MSECISLTTMSSTQLAAAVVTVTVTVGVVAVLCNCSTINLINLLAPCRFMIALELKYVRVRARERGRESVCVSRHRL